MRMLPLDGSHPGAQGDRMDPAAFSPPSPDEIKLARALIEPFRRAFSPVFLGLDHVPAGAGPLLFVGNHTLYGALDVPHLFLTLHEEKGIWLRGLGDHAHFSVPVWRRFVTHWGVVDGTPENTAALSAADFCASVTCPKACVPALPMPSSSARTRRPPSAESRTLTFFSDMKFSLADGEPS